MADSFWTSSWGKIIRKIGVYAAGTIPLVGALAQTIVKVADEETFQVKTKRRPIAPQPTQSATATTTLIQPKVTLTTGPAPPQRGYGRTDRR